MPTFTLDAYKDWTPERLKEHCRKLARALIRDQRIVAMFVEYAPEGLQHLPAEYQKQAKYLNLIYRDDEPASGFSAPHNSGERLPSSDAAEPEATPISNGTRGGEA